MASITKEASYIHNVNLGPAHGNWSLVDGVWTNYDITGVGTDRLIYESFPFNIPSDSVIDGIELTIYHTALTLTTKIFDKSIRIYKGSSQGQNKANDVYWNFYGNMVIYGSSTDLWGLTWTVDEINTLLKVGIEAYLDFSGTAEAEINSLSVTVYYHQDVSIQEDIISINSASNSMSFIGAYTHMPTILATGTMAININLSLGHTLQILKTLIGMLNITPRIVSPTMKSTNRPNRFIEYSWIKSKRNPKLKVTKSPYNLED